MTPQDAVEQYIKAAHLPEHTKEETDRLMESIMVEVMTGAKHAGQQMAMIGAVVRAAGVLIGMQDDQKTRSILTRGIIDVAKKARARRLALKQTN
jgi:hypothetical protein